MGDSFDSSPNNIITPKEMGKGSKSLDPPVGNTDAAKVAKAISKDKRGVLKKEWNDFMGGCETCHDEFSSDDVNMKEFKKRCKKKWKTPKASFEGLGGGKK